MHIFLDEGFHLGWNAVLAITTFALAAAAFLSARAAIRIDRLNAQRQRKRDHDRERAVARLICSELEAAHRAASDALNQRQWPLWQTMRRDGWDRNGHAIASRIDEELFAALARSYDHLTRWQDRVSKYREEFPASPGAGVASMSLSGSLPRESEAQEALSTCELYLRESVRQLRSVAFPGGREVEQDPDWLPTRRQRLIWWWQRRRQGRDAEPSRSRA